jgi:SAM-dependent methyltransferase
MSRWMRHSADFPEFYKITGADTVVDVGCGPGDASVAAGMLGAEVIAIDVDPNLIPHLHQRMTGVPARGFRAIASDCDPIPLPDGIASYVICTEVLEHVEDPVRFAAELSRIGRPGATYLISVPDPASEYLMRAVAHRSYFEAPNHRRIFEHHEFDELLRAAGLDVVERPRSPNNFYWSMWALLRWAASPDGNPDPGSLPPVIDRWNEVFDVLQSSPRGEQALGLLDEMIPRSQMVISRKSGRVPNFSHIDNRWRVSLRGGKVHLGHVELHWTLRRRRPGQVAASSGPAPSAPNP